MKLDKEQGKKVILSAILLCALLYCYFNLLLGPLAANEVRAEKTMKELRPQIAAAKLQIKQTQAIEARAPVASETLEQIKGMIPDGAPVAWFPPRMAEFFKRQGIDKTATRQTGEQAAPDLAGFKKLTWTIDLPKVEFVPLAIAIAGLENEEPLLEVTGVSIGTGADPQYQHGSISVTTIVRQ